MHDVEGGRPVAELPAGLSPRRRARPAARVVAWLLIGVSVLALVGGGLLYLVIARVDSAIPRIPVRVPDCTPGQRDCVARPPKLSAAGKVTNYLVIGSDSVDDVSAADRERLHITDVANRSGRRSDTMLLVHVPADAPGAHVLSFPRDLYVEIPGLARKNKINAAYATGGPVRAIQTVEQLTGVRIDHYVEINVVAFAGIVDSLGGVPICLPQGMKSPKAHLDLAAGRHTLDGPTALSFVRARSFSSDSEFKDPRGDLGRIERQQLFIGALVRRVLSSSTLTQPVRLARFVDRSAKAVTVDDELEMRQLLELGKRFRSLDTKRVVFASVPVDNPGLDVPGAGKVATIHHARAAPLFASIADGSVLGGRSAAPRKPRGPKLTVPPASVRVLVRNGSGVPGRAGATADDLRDVGFAVVGAADADRSDYTETVVRHAPGKLQSAQTLAAALSGARLEEVAGLRSTLEVVVGRTAPTVKAVQVEPPVAPATKPPVTAADDACS